MRAFFCLELDPSIKASMQHLARPLQRAAARVSWVKPENYHLTLKFLGEIDPGTLPKLHDIAEATVRHISPFSYVLECAGAFPNLQKPRVIWIGAARVPAALVGLHSQLEDHLHELGFDRERQFTAHITLGRVKEESRTLLENLGARLQKLDRFQFTAHASHLTLMESQLTPHGSIYKPVFHSPFAGV